MYRVATRPVSKLVALLPAAEPPPTFAELEQKLSRAGLPVSLRQNASGSRIRALLQEPGGTRRFDVEVNATELLPKYVELARLRGGDFDAALASQFFLSVSCKLGHDVLDSLHAQLRLLAALAPDAVAILDLNAFHAKTGDWMRDAASASVPPAPTSFFSVHSVFDDGRKGRETWLHTHGLHRMGSIELDIVGVRGREAPALAELINNVARFFIDCGVPLPNTRFHAGNGLPLVWLPWEAALRQVDGSPGGAGDRDADHAGERGILFAPAKESPERLETPRCYVPMIEADPIFYVSSAETERMQRLARERLPSFLALQSRFAKNRKWDFHVKLGFPTDRDAGSHDHDHGGAEHLWFDVHKATAKGVDGTLLNEPYRIAGLREGQRGTFDLRLLTDWAIESPRGRYTPESVLQLERGLANDRVSARPLLH